MATSARSMRVYCSGNGMVTRHNWDPCSRGNPPVVGLEVEPKLVVADPQVSVRTAVDRRRHDFLHVLRHHPNVGLRAAIVDEPIEAETVVEITQQSDVVRS